MNPRDRHRLEAAIIAEAVYYKSGYQEIAHILKPENFISGRDVNGRPLHRIIWRTIGKMYPNEPVNIITVSKKLNEKHGVSHSELPEITAHLHTDAMLNRQHYCFLLLEDDLRTSFTAFIKKLSDRHKNDYENYKAWLEMIEYVSSPLNDIFNCIQNTSEFLSSKAEFEAEYDELLAFREKIDERIKEIKQMSQVRSLMSNLESFYNFPSQRKLVIGCLVDLLKTCLISSELPSNFEDEVLKLKNKLS